ncbi:hypothetical protein [Kitasatospora sp. NPDC051914]|uniref:hypothetical protein n=1 Tax=Kitasatospora sp. NPDC051914 TaxID=3154945 RepID=UPI003443869A
MPITVLSLPLPASVRVRRARAGDADVVADLVSLVDLNRPAGDVSVVLDKLRALVAHRFPAGPLSHASTTS